jgi:hypothetical protein
MKFIYYIVLAITIIVAMLSISDAPLVQANEAGQDSTQGAPLIQCGGNGQATCTLCHFFILLRDIFNLALQLLASLAILSIIIGGVYILLSGVSSSMFSQGVEIIRNAVIGIVLTGISFVALNTLLVILGFQSASFQNSFTIEGAFFRIECDSADYFRDRGPAPREIGDNSPSNGGGGNGGTVTCSTGRCANNAQLRAAIQNNKYNIEANLLLALFEAGEGCNPAVRQTCVTRGYADRDCSCGYSQCTPDNRRRSTGISDPKASCDYIRSNLQADVDCAARLINQNKGMCGLSVRNVASCYNSGRPNNCPNTTKRYCDRVENYYKTC